MAETRKKSTTTTKTKTAPAKKPATKPAGKSVKPKATKTVAAKTTTKSAPAKNTTTAKSAKTSSTTTKTNRSTASSKKTAPKKCNICKIIFSIIVAVAIIAVATWAIVWIIDRSNNETVMVENGKGEKVEMKYASLSDYKYRVLIPSSFQELSAEQIKNDYGETEAPELVYSDKDNTVNIAFSAPNGALANTQIKEYLNTMKTILSTGMEVIGSEMREVDGHNIGILKLNSELDGEKVYNQMAFFSYENKLAIITFNCKDSVRAEWEKIGNEIINSINFTK